MGTAKETPMARQWRELKTTLPPDVLLFFRLGDFYELFDDDAERAAATLELTLTRRAERPMCGVPHHAARDYIARALKAGYRVALAEQVGEVKPGKLVDREITQILSASTVLDGQMLEADRGNWLAAVQTARAGFALAALDHSTGEFQLLALADRAELEAALARLRPAELIYPEPQRAQLADVPGSQACLRLVDPHAFEAEAARRLLCRQFGVNSLDGFGLRPEVAGAAFLTGSAGAAVHYLTLILQQKADHLRPPKLVDLGGHLLLDPATLASLDIVESRSGRAHSLLAAVDLTQTAAGARLLRTWLTQPSRVEDEIRARQDFIARVVADPARRQRLRHGLRTTRDIERATARLSQGSGTARDLAALVDSLAAVPGLAAELADLAHTHSAASPPAAAHQPACRAGELQSELPDLADLRQSLDAALAADLPPTVQAGGLIRDGFHPELDELRAAMARGRDWLAELQQRESLATGIKTLKIKFNSVFGYFLEVTRTQQDKVPPTWVRKQTTAGAERFVTEELKRLEEKILGAEERAKSLEYQLFLELRRAVLAELPQLQRIAAALAQLDVLTGLAERAATSGWVRPELAPAPLLEIEAGRHPVLDLVKPDFVANDTRLHPEERRLILVTGPNMAGKSTYIRQTALLVLLAQTGSFVPARAMRFGLADRIFARVGASDDLARGQSTFMVEMAETAAILHQATARSLVILDEIGRGTATWDGLSLAWSIAEFLHDGVRCRTLFATHYHELTALNQRCPAVANAQVAVQETEGRIVFLHRILDGSADKSYGIQVARLAGLPEPVLERARHLLSTLEGEAQRLVIADAQLATAPAAESADQLAQPAGKPADRPVDRPVKSTPRPRPPAPTHPDLFASPPEEN